MTEVFEQADAALPSRDTCTFLRAAAAGALMKLFPTPRRVACTSHLCEGAPKIARLAADTAGVGVSFIDVPSASSHDTIEYVAAQLEALARQLCESGNTAFDIDRIREAIDLSNRAREHFFAVYEMRKHVPAPVTGSQFIGMGLMYPWGTKMGIEIAQSLRDEISARIEQGSAAIENGEKYRLMWLHLRPIFETDIMPHLEQEMGAVIVADLMGQAWWPEMDSRRPFRALAQKMLSNPELQPVDRRTERVLQLAEEYNVDGVVHFLQWGCRWNYGQSGVFKKVLTRAKIPFLALDGDAVDKRASPHGQILTRLEGFVELLENTKAARRNA
jgi:benzoyl-CoA reductase/2-hydroxyglutaryl-CoA dehydratase subunit BcrC/BadD/HgdB